MKNKRLVFTAIFLTTLGSGVLVSFAKTSPMNSINTSAELKAATILKKSHISYQADGGFTAVKSYSVYISCIDGKISTLSTILDPKLNGNGSSPIRHTGTMDQQAYLNLWDKLNHMAVFEKKNAPNPRMDILDEFTVTFEASIGKQENQFSVVGCSRPEASQYFAFRKILDSAVSMENLWQSHQALAQK